MKNKKRYNFAAISGSLRKDSYNSMILKIVQKLAPENILIERLSINEIPLYNADLFENELPEAVDILADKIKSADALIIATPEYNFSVPGVLKNTIDFLSCSSKKPFNMKPVGIIGASTGMLGSSRSQYHLRQIMVGLNAYAMNEPGIMITRANKKFDSEGNLVDEKTQEALSRFIVALADFSNLFTSQKE